MAIGISPEALARSSARRPWVIIGIWVLVLLGQLALLILFSFYI